jgi:hypothetical protein
MSMAAAGAGLLSCGRVGQADGSVTFGGVAVAASSARTRSSRGLLLFLWFVAPLVELGGVLLFCAAAPDLAQDTAFGSPATEILAVIVLAVTVVGTILVWRGVSGALRWITATALFIAAALTVALGVSFATAGILALFTLLMAHSALFIALIGRAALRSPAGNGR